MKSLNGPDFGPYSGLQCCALVIADKVSTGLTSAHIPDSRSPMWISRRCVSTGLTSAHIPDFGRVLAFILHCCLNGPDFGPYSGLNYFSQMHTCAVSTGLTSAHIPDNKLLANNRWW